MPGYFRNAAATLKNVFRRNTVAPIPQAEVSAIPMASVSIATDTNQPGQTYGTRGRIVLPGSTFGAQIAVLDRASELRRRIDMLLRAILIVQGGVYNGTVIPPDRADYLIRIYNDEINTAQDELRTLS